MEQVSPPLALGVLGFSSPEYNAICEGVKDLAIGFSRDLFKMDVRSFRCPQETARAIHDLLIDYMARGDRLLTIGE